MTDENAGRIAADSIGYHMLDAIVGEFQQVPGFANLTEAQQQVHINRLDQLVRKLIGDAFSIVFKADYPACVGELGDVKFGKVIKTTLMIEKSAHSRHELADRSGQKCVVVLADQDVYFARMKEVRARADQGELFHDSAQPLGHMGVKGEPSGSDDLFDAPGGETGLDDKQPDELESVTLELVSADSVWAALSDLGVAVIGDGLGLWPEELLNEAMVWAIAAKAHLAQGNELPAFPEELRGRLLVTESHARDTDVVPPADAGTEAATSLPVEANCTPRVVDIDPSDIKSICSELEARGVKLKRKIVSAWSLSQRVAAVAWFNGRSPHKPDFIPEPSMDASSAKESESP